MENLTLSHALSKNSVKDLKELVERFNTSTEEEKIDPNAGKQDLISSILQNIPDNEKEKIIDNTFNKPKYRYTAHLGLYNFEILSEDNINNNCKEFDKHHGFDSKIPDYKINQKETLSLVAYEIDKITFYYTEFTKRPEYDEDAMESRPIISSRRIRITVNVGEKQVTVFTGDRDLFNKALTALTLVLGGPVVPLDLNMTQISEMTKGSFSFHTVKTLDFIYHGLSKVGRIGAITHIELETNARSKTPQRVKVQGDELLDDKSICEYLLLHSRDLVGLKLVFTFLINENEYKSSIEIGIRDSRIKIGVKKESYSLDKIKEFFNILESTAQKQLKEPGLINEKATIKILDKIRSKALG